MKVYESEIEICLEPLFSEVCSRDDEIQRELEPIYKRHCKQGISADQALIRLYWERASNLHKVARENGYIGSYHNCVFHMLYEIFGVDIIAYLFNQAWIPSTTINPFRPGVFLERLAVLETAVRELKDGAKTPLALRETADYFISGIGPEMEFFSETEHRVVLTYSLRELRGFSELGLSLERRGQKPKVHINIYDPYELFKDATGPLARPRGTSKA